jgi:hypothetical protein
VIIFRFPDATQDITYSYDLDREGRHAFHGPGKPERFIVWANEHARLHLADIQKILQ